VQIAFPTQQQQQQQQQQQHSNLFLTTEHANFYNNANSTRRVKHQWQVNFFRRRFRRPYNEFLELVNMAKESELFQRWLGFDAVGKAAWPTELMVLGALRYLDRGWTFDDLEESTTISEETHRQFFYVFI
jgi:hypothetical protein